MNSIGTAPVGDVTGDYIPPGRAGERKSETGGLESLRPRNLPYARGRGRSTLKVGATRRVAQRGRGAALLTNLSIERQAIMGWDPEAMKLL